MKKIRLLAAGFLMSSMMLTACGEENNTPSVVETTGSVELVVPSAAETEQSNTNDSSADVIEDDEIPEGYVRSQYTNELITVELDQQRPVFVMTPDDSTALPHYSISQAELMYECRVEGTISRLMVMYHDWAGMESDRIGNIRSCREYYAYWAAEWDSVILHFGNPFYANEILASEHVEHIDGNTAVTGVYYRSTDRSAPQNAYTSSEGIEYGFDYYKISKTHTDRYQPGHFTFAPNGGQSDLSGINGVFDCTTLDLANLYPIDKPYYIYNEEDKKYYRYQYGKEHCDAVNGEQLAFSNIVIQDCVWAFQPDNKYLWYNTVDSGKGYFLTNGKCVPVTWTKSSVESPTKFYDLDGNEIVFSTGKTIFCINQAGNATPTFK